MLSKLGLITTVGLPRWDYHGGITTVNWVLNLCKLGFYLCQLGFDKCVKFDWVTWKGQPISSRLKLGALTYAPRKNREILTVNDRELVSSKVDLAYARCRVSFNLSKGGALI